MENDLYTRGKKGRYQNPVFAAVATDCHEALETIIKFDRQIFPEGTVFPWSSDNLCSFLAEHKRCVLVPRLISSFYTFDTTWTLEDGETLLHRAATDHSVKFIEALLARGVDVNAEGGFYGNALQAASCYGFEEAVQLLLEKGAKVNAQGGFYGNALQAAASCDGSEVVKLLLEKGNNISGTTLCNALREASAQGHEKIVQLLLAKGARHDFVEDDEKKRASEVEKYSASSQRLRRLLCRSTDQTQSSGQASHQALPPQPLKPLHYLQRLRQHIPSRHRRPDP